MKKTAKFSLCSDFAFTIPKVLSVNWILSVYYLLMVFNYSFDSRQATCTSTWAEAMFRKAVDLQKLLVSYSHQTA